MTDGRIAVAMGGAGTDAAAAFGLDDADMEGSGGPPAALQSHLDGFGQGHVTEYWSELSASERRALCDQIAGIDFGAVRTAFDDAVADASKTSEGPSAPPAPVDGAQVCAFDSLDGATRDDLYRQGLGLIAHGKVGVILLAGGQGTRLGTSLPKGCVDIGLPSHKGLFQIQAERILRLQSLAAREAFGEGATPRHPIRWYVMLSAATREYTKTFFQEHACFGLSPDQIVFFEQGRLPCLSPAGAALMATAGRIAESPDGNGGIYKALAVSGCIADMRLHGVDYVDCYSVDNLLVKIADPFFVGYCHSRQVDLGCRALAKAYPEEKVGVFVKRGDGIGVVEYSELDPAVSSSVDASGALVYNWSNICMQYYATNFLERICGPDVRMTHHLATKDIPTVKGKERGVKLEKFIFDVFPEAKRTCLVEVKREEEFAPVKNAFGAERDSPDTARRALMALHRRWAQAAGVPVTGAGDEGIEISPLVSYGGEGLRALQKSASLEANTEITTLPK